MTAEQSTYLETHTAKLAAAPATDATPKAKATRAAESTDCLIKGKTTFGDILGWGVSQASIETVLGKPIPTDLTILVKDFCTANSLDFEVIKPALQAEVNKIK